MNTHTPGPWGWTYDGSGDYSIGPADDPQVDVIAYVSEREAGHKDWQRATANAQLIAAAPELLEELRIVRNVLITACGETAPFVKVALKRIDAVIAKAEGE